MIDNLKELENLSSEERLEVLKIFKELSDSGISEEYNNLILQDYDEIPVDIETFLRDPKYLGKGLINEEGKFTVYTYWLNLLKEIFPDPLKPATYNTLALTGAIGLGKSFVAVLVGLYELYRMLCLKDPYIYYGLQPIDKITFAVMNITLDASKGVAWDKMQQLIQSSEWFMSRGKLSGSVNVEWTPNKNIELIAGSLSRHIIGRAVFWCLDGETEIATNFGDVKLKDVVGKEIQVYNIDDSGNICLSDSCTVLPTATESTEYQIELEDGTVIKCTPTHRFMLSDGTYKQAQDLTEEDDILEFKPYGYVYKITNKVNGKSYIGKRVSDHFDDKYWGSGKLIKRAISKYGLSNFDREILQWARNREELESLEIENIAKYNSITEGYNLTEGGSGGDTTSGSFKITNGIDETQVYHEEDIPEGWHKGSKNKGVKKSTTAVQNMKDSWTTERRNTFSKKVSGEGNSQYKNSDSHTGSRNGMYGKHHSEETKAKISKANKGRKYSEEVNKSKGRPGVKKPEGFGEKIRQANIGTHWYNNGQIQRKYRDEDCPIGWKRGVLK